MALGRRKVRQEELWVPSAKLTRAASHPFYRRLNQEFEVAGFDRFVEGLCAPHCAGQIGRPGIAPGVYFRMLLVGYFEGIDSQRGIAWRCQDSLALREFLGLALDQEAPDHSALTHIRRRLPQGVYEAVFQFVLSMVRSRSLLKAKTLGLDATMLEANAAMKSIVRKGGGEDWKGYLRGLAKREGIQEPSDEELRKMDKGRKDKRVSNKEWESPSDPESRIAKMKDGRTHLAYKAEHAVDLDTGIVVAARVTPADAGDAQSAVGTLVAAQANLILSGGQEEIAEAVADRGYHSVALLAECADLGVRTYIAERKDRSKRRWADKEAGLQRAFRANRRRMRGARGKGLSRRRSELVERSFAHVCETGGGRRMWVRGMASANKVHLVRVCAHNLGVLMRKAFGMSKPRSMVASAGFEPILSLLLRALRLLFGIRLSARSSDTSNHHLGLRHDFWVLRLCFSQNPVSSTGC